MCTLLIKTVYYLFFSSIGCCQQETEAEAQGDLATGKVQFCPPAI